MKISCFLISTYKSADNFLRRNLPDILFGSEDAAHRELSFGMHMAVHLRASQKISAKNWFLGLRWLCLFILHIVSIFINYSLDSSRFIISSRPAVELLVMVLTIVAQKAIISETTTIKKKSPFTMSAKNWKASFSSPWSKCLCNSSFGWLVQGSPKTF